MVKNDTKYFQFLPQGREYPVYVSIENSLAQEEMVSILEQCCFQLLPADSKDQVIKNVYENEGRILHLSVASLKIAQRIGRELPDDQYGPESITKRGNYKVYRYRGHALMIYSPFHREWEMGMVTHFANSQTAFIFKTILNRYISWSVAPFGVIGFWGEFSQDRITLLRPKESKASAVYIDLKNNLIITHEKTYPIMAKLEFIRIDQHIRGGRIQMSKEEFLGLLHGRCIFFDFDGPSTPIKQMLNVL